MRRLRKTYGLPAWQSAERTASGRATSILSTGASGQKPTRAAAVPMITASA